MRGPSLHLGKVAKTKIILPWHQFPLCSLSKHFSCQIKNVLCVHVTGDLGHFWGLEHHFLRATIWGFFVIFPFLPCQIIFCVFCASFMWLGRCWRSLSAEGRLRELGLLPGEKTPERDVSEGTNPSNSTRGTNEIWDIPAENEEKTLYFGCRRALEEAAWRRSGDTSEPWCCR